MCSVWVGMCAVCGWECVQCGCVQCVGGHVCSVWVGCVQCVGRDVCSVCSVWVCVCAVCVWVGVCV